MLQKRCSGALILAVLMLALAGPAHASLDMKSSMTASCSNEACDEITFRLAVPDQDGYTNAFVDIIRIKALKEFFQFDAVLDIWHYVDGVKKTLSWTPQLYDDVTNPEIEIAMSSGLPAAEPIYLRIRFVSADAAHLTDGSVQYTANGIMGDGSSFSTQGQVTPEPVTMLLMGTGLMGVAGAARRRRKAVQSA